MRKIIALFLFLLGFLIVIVIWQWKIVKERPVEKSVNSFDECAQAGYPVMESYPRQCKTPSGKIFFEVISESIKK